jgi:two-component system phosphate regulon sensor histidine kinase PhoR
LIKEKTVSGILITMTDVTFQKQLERLRQDFVANVSHELKTPITSMLGYMEIIQSSNIEGDKKHEFYGKVLNQTNRMNDIIDDLLRLSKIESQEEDSSIELVSMEIKAILEGSVDDVFDKAQKNNNRILIHCGDIRANVDAQLLREDVFIHIENSGQRIPDKHRDKIFQRFYRVDKSRDRKAGGTGLGLAIVKHIALVHGGEVFVSDSKKDKCRFTISLPKIS